MAAYRDRLHMDPPYANVLRDAGLDTVSRVLGCTGDRLAAWSRTTDTGRRPGRPIPTSRGISPRD